MVEQMIIGGIQALSGRKRERRATRELESMQMPAYTPSQSISDYYSKALQRYNTDPYQSQFYKQQSQQINRGMSQGLSALNDRGMALAGVNSLVQGQNDALLRAGAAAEEQQNQRFGELGRASQLKAGEDMNVYQYNKLAPFQRRSDLLSAKAASGGALMNAGLTNVFSGLQNMKNMALQLATGGLGGGGGNMPFATGGGGDRDIPASTFQVPKIPYR